MIHFLVLALVSRNLQQHQSYKILQSDKIRLALFLLLHFRQEVLDFFQIFHFERPTLDIFLVSCVGCHLTQPPVFQLSSKQGPFFLQTFSIDHGTQRLPWQAYPFCQDLDRKENAQHQYCGCLYALQPLVLFQSH